MAKKIKFHFNPRLHPGLFDDLDLPDNALEEPPAMPSVEEFIVNELKREAESEPTEPDNPLAQPIDGLRERDCIYFISFGSGSSGNTALVADNTGGFLIDAGVDLTKVTDTLAQIGFSMKDIKGIILTHDHSDHVHYVYSYVRRNPHIGVYCTPRAFNGIMRRHGISRRLKDYHHAIHPEIPFTLAGFQITAFSVSHDGTDNAGFFITRADGSGPRLAVATDLGCITDRVDYYMRRATHIVIESNYDATMLRNGPYPAHLKARIASDTGHLDNLVAAGYIASIASPELCQVMLCHLSQDNNRPEIATAAMTNALNHLPEISDTPIGVCALPRLTPSTLFTLRTKTGPTPPEK